MPHTSPPTCSRDACAVRRGHRRVAIEQARNIHVARRDLRRYEAISYHGHVVGRHALVRRRIQHVAGRNLGHPGGRGRLRGRRRQRPDDARVVRYPSNERSQRIARPASVQLIRPARTARGRCAHRATSLVRSENYAVRVLGAASRASEVRVVGDRKAGAWPLGRRVAYYCAEKHQGTRASAASHLAPVGETLELITGNNNKNEHDAGMVAPGYDRKPVLFLPVS